MTVFDYLSTHPFLAFVYLLIAGGLLVASVGAFRPVTIRHKTVNHAPAAAHVESDEEESAEDEAPEDEGDDPAGQEHALVAIRFGLSTGERTFDVVPDLAQPIASVLSLEDWTVTIGDVLVSPVMSLAPMPPTKRTRLTFVWSPEVPA